MAEPFGLNILGQFVHDGAALLDWIGRAKPQACVVMDSIMLAQGIRQRSPATTVIYRAYNANDHRWWEVTTPGAWLAAHGGFAVNGVVLQVLNEPTLNDAALTWLEELVHICPPTITLAFPNFGVGNPNETDIQAGKYDRLLRLVCGTPHIFVLHEYFKDDPIGEYPYLCGRFTYWLKRANTLGLPAPRIVITEHGRDVGGGVNDGWRGQGWSDADYLNRLVRARDLYKPVAIPVCIYCYGTGAANRWKSFDVQDAPDLLNLMAEYEEKPTVPAPDYTTHDWGALVNPVTASATDPINRRSLPTENSAGTPTGMLLGTLKPGDVVAYYDKPFQNTKYRWYKIVYGDDTCYVAQVAGLTFTPVVIPPPDPPPTEETVELPIGDVEQAIAEQTALIASLRAAVVNAENTIALLRGKKLPDAPFPAEPAR